MEIHKAFVSILVDTELLLFMKEIERCGIRLISLEISLKKPLSHSCASIMPVIFVIMDLGEVLTLT